MVVFSNHRLGPSAEVLVSDDVARAVLGATADAARPFAEARWEIELVMWLDRRGDQIGEAAARSEGATRESSRGERSDRGGRTGRAGEDGGGGGAGAGGRRGGGGGGGHVLDVADIAWTPEHFEAQRRFLINAIDRAAASEGGGAHGLAFDRWRRMIEAHPADSVQVGRRWQWQPTA
ncbi:MAG TPA: hypothetical protein VMZ53_13055 [Kofleriaceae bacterium]|nr:hypothetical protein [Kofleriaceae bacterium]